MPIDLQAGVVAPAMDSHRASGQGSTPVAEEAAPPSFFHLAEALGTVRRLYPDLPVLGIQWFHLMHPLHPVQEALLRDVTMATGHPEALTRRGGWFQRLGEWAALVGRQGRCVAYAIYLTSVLVRLRWRVRKAVAQLTDQPFDVVAKTWCFGAASEKRDFYYGDLQRRTAERGRRMLLLAGDGAGSDWRVFSRAHVSAGEPSKLPEWALLPLTAPFRMACKQLVGSIRLRRIGGRSSDVLLQEIGARASRDCLLPSTARNGLLFWVGRTAVRRWHPRAFVTLYEGHGWEKCAWWGVKTADPMCVTVGYQHTVVFPESWSLTRPVIESAQRSVPDLVLSSGTIPSDMMRPGHAGQRTRFIRFGSFRHKGHAVDRPSDADLKTVLVTPEGIASETKALFAFAYQCALSIPTYTFILRSHPAIPMTAALKFSAVDLARAPNLVVSEQASIEEDFKRSSVLMYRGSSSVLYAILNGLFPLNVRLAALFDTDPLYQLGCWRKTCSTPEEFAASLTQHEARAREDVTEEWKAALRYVNEYTVPVTAAGIDQFIRAIGLQGGGSSRVPPRDP